MTKPREYTLRFTLVGCARLVFLGFILAGMSVGVLIYMRGPILTWFGQQLVDVDPPAVSDAIVVLAGGTPERELEAAMLYAQKQAPLVVLTSPPEPSAWTILEARGIGHHREIDIRRVTLENLGVPRTRTVVLEQDVESTVDEARVVSAWAKGAGVRRLLVVTSTFHTSRAKRVYRRFLDREISVRIRGASADTFSPHSWWRSRTGLRQGFIEWQKNLFYRLRY